MRVLLQNGGYKMSTKIKHGRNTTSDFSKGICEDCGRKLPDPVLENREGGYSESVTYCKCGAVYTN